MDSRIQTTCLLILTLIATSFALYWLRPVLIPFVLALFIYLGLSSFVDFQVARFRIPRGVALATTIVVSLLLFTTVAVLVTASVRQITSQADTYQAQFGEMLANLAALIPGDYGIDRKTLLAPLSEIPMSTVGSLLAQTANAILATLSRSLLVFVFVLYLMFGSAKTRKPNAVWTEIESRVQRYITAKAFLSAATGVLVTTILAILNVDLALAFGLFAFMLNFIPTVGSIIATLLPLPVVLFGPEQSAATATAAIVLPGVVQLIIGNVVEPRIMGQSLDLHPITVLMALIFWGMLWGILGMLLAVPITAVAKILFEQLDTTLPMAQLLAGRFGSAESEEA
jgi:AI-2 transport protein TqsA